MEKSILSLKVVFVNNEIRRVAVERNLSFAALVTKLEKMFNQTELTTKYVVKYRDEEGDIVTVTSDEELLEAIRLVKQDALKIYINKKPNKDAPAQEQQQGGCPRYRCGKRGFWNHFQNRDGDQEEPKPIHYSVICDGCNVTPIVGARYKDTVRHDFDYCEKCYEKAPKEEQKNFFKIERPHQHGGCHGRWRHWRNQQSGCPFSQQAQVQAPVSVPAPAPAPVAEKVEEKPAPVVEKPITVQLDGFKLSQLPPVVAPTTSPVVPPVATQPVVQPVVAQPIVKPVVAQPVVQAPQPARFEISLGMLEGMGFLNRQANIEALVKHRGSVESAVAYLLSKQ